MNKDVFIIYYSWSGNTGSIARLIHQKTSGQLFQVNPVQAYPSDYGACVEQAKKEIHTRFLPEIENSKLVMNKTHAVILAIRRGIERWKLKETARSPQLKVRNRERSYTGDVR
jgi:hypothetical protein